MMHLDNAVAVAYIADTWVPLCVVFEWAGYYKFVAEQSSEPREAGKRWRLQRALERG